MALGSHKRNLIKEISCPSPWNIFELFESHEVKAFYCKSTYTRKFDLELILQEGSDQNSCRQMQTVLDSNLCAMSMSGLISNNYQFLAKHIFLQKWPMVSNVL